MTPFVQDYDYEVPNQICYIANSQFRAEGVWEWLIGQMFIGILKMN